MKISLLPLILLAAHQLTTLQTASIARVVYWRDYDGTIPEDAIIGIQNANTSNVYIAQACLSINGTSGLIPGAIHSGDKDLTVVYDLRALKTNKCLKILSGPQQSLSWFPTRGERARQDLADKTPVVGGYQSNFEDHLTYIGRITTSGQTYIGKVTENELYTWDNMIIQFIRNGTSGYSTGDFDVLVAI